jgi:hypothetical protein
MYHKVAVADRKMAANEFADRSVASLFSATKEVCTTQNAHSLAVLGMTPKHNHHPVGSLVSRCFTPENLTFDAVGACMYHKVAECRTEKWQPMNLLSVIDPSASLFSYQEVCTTQVHHSRGARNDA